MSSSESRDSVPETFAGVGVRPLSQGCEDCPLRCAVLERSLGGSPGGRRPPYPVGVANCGWCRAAGVGSGCSSLFGLLFSEGPQLVTGEPILADSIPEGGLNGEGREFGPRARDGGLPPPDPLSFYPSVRSVPLSLPCWNLGAQEMEQMPCGGGGSLGRGGPPNSSGHQESSVLCWCPPSALWDMGLVSGAISRVLPLRPSCPLRWSLL